MAGYEIDKQMALDALKAAAFSLEKCSEGCECHKQVTAALFAVSKFVDNEWPGVIFVENDDSEAAKGDCIHGNMGEYLN